MIQPRKGDFMESTISSDWKCCATCSYWGGCARGDFSRLWVTYIDKPDKCCGGGFHNCEMQPMSCCSMWEQRYRPNR